MVSFSFITITTLLPLLAIASPVDNAVLANGPIKACSLPGQGSWIDGTTSCCRQDNWRHYQGGLIACQTGKDTEKFDACCRSKNPSAGVIEYPK
jgi:hypothetical protein